MESLITKATVTEWSFGIIGILGAIGGLCGIIGKILTTSRCSDCSVCWGICKVKNDPLDAEELKVLDLNLENPPVKQEIKKEEEEKVEEVSLSANAL
tara:strand:+ start:815 stop:1105 length:291 start_codon:yes stop_codon:yes gene_type:complete